MDGRKHWKNNERPISVPSIVRLCETQFGIKIPICKALSYLGMVMEYNINRISQLKELLSDKRIIDTIERLLKESPRGGERTIFQEIQNRLEKEKLKIRGQKELANANSFVDKLIHCTFKYGPLLYTFRGSPDIKSIVSIIREGMINENMI